MVVVEGECLTTCKKRGKIIQGGMSGETCREEIFGSPIGSAKSCCYPRLRAARDYRTEL